jgi:hypothetical protein
MRNDNHDPNILDFADLQAEQARMATEHIATKEKRRAIHKGHC